MAERDSAPRRRRGWCRNGMGWGEPLSRDEIEFGIKFTHGKKRRESTKIHAIN
jgi:hypothetical protein